LEDMDLRKKLMTQEYGNYEKYAKNKVREITENSAEDKGLDTLWTNYVDMSMRLKGLHESEYQAT